MSVIKVNQNNFASLGSGKVLLDFYADWCGPCRMVSPIIEEIAGERADVVVGKVNGDEERALAERFNVYSIPTLVVLKDGAILHQVSGARPKAAIVKLLDE